MLFYTTTGCIEHRTHHVYVLPLLDQMGSPKSAKNSKVRLILYCILLFVEQADRNVRWAPKHNFSEVVTRGWGYDLLGRRVQTIIWRHPRVMVPWLGAKVEEDASRAQSVALEEKTLFLLLCWRISRRSVCTQMIPPRGADYPHVHYRVLYQGHPGEWESVSTDPKYSKVTIGFG